MFARKERVVTRRRRWTTSLLLLLFTPALGVLVRFAHVGLPWSVRKYGGSVLWAAMVYWVISTLLAGLSPIICGAYAEGIAIAVEFLKKVHTPGLEAFRSTLAGILLLGREFSYTDLLAYSVAIACAVAGDLAMRRRPLYSNRPSVEDHLAGRK